MRNVIPKAKTEKWIVVYRIGKDKKKYSRTITDVPVYDTSILKHILQSHYNDIWERTNPQHQPKPQYPPKVKFDGKYNPEYIGYENLFKHEIDEPNHDDPYSDISYITYVGKIDDNKRQTPLDAKIRSYYT